MRKILIALSLSALASNLFIISSAAQSQYKYPIILPNKKSSAKPEPPKPQGKEIDLPNLPKFPGARFISGEELKKEDGVSTAYTVQYSIPKSSELQVIPFYANALSNGGWNITHQSENVINAVNNKICTRCNISTSSDSDFFSNMTVSYCVTSSDLMPQ